MVKKSTFSILKVGLFVIIPIPLGICFTNAIYQYFDGSPLVSQSIEINHYRLYGLLYVTFDMVLIKLNNEKKQRKWQYLLSLIIFSVSYMYILKNCPYFNTGLDRKDAILVKNLYMIFIPAICVLLISFIGEYLPIHKKYLQISWYIFYFLMFVIQIDVVQSLYQYASDTSNFKVILMNNHIIRNILITHVFLISISFMSEKRPNKHLMYAIISIIVGYSLICLIAHFSLNMNIEAMKYDFIFCQFIPLLSIILSASIKSIDHNLNKSICKNAVDQLL